MYCVVIVYTEIEAAASCSDSVRGGDSGILRIHWLIANPEDRIETVITTIHY